MKKKKYIVRTYSAGVFFGEIRKRIGKEVHMTNARRIWYWDGAATLSELAMRGTSKPGNCKFPAAVPSLVLTEVIEVIKCSAEAMTSIEGVAVWTQH